MFKKKILVLLNSLMLVSSFGIPVLAEENPYREKVLSVNTLYDVGEANLTANDIVQVNGVDCYVLQVDEENNKAELITKGIYDVRFNTINTGAQSEYNYKTSDLKTWMDNFYTNQLGSDGYILNSNVTSYYVDYYPHDFTVFSTESLTQHVFALDAKEANANKLKFSWNYEDGFIDNPSTNVYNFWVSAGCLNDGSSTSFNVNCQRAYTGFLAFSAVSSIYAGARPAFWISLGGAPSKNTNIYYDVTEGYEWSVPSKIEFTSTSFENVNATGNDSQVKITKNVIKEGKRLVISLDDENDLKLSETTGHELAYQVFADNSELSIGGEVLSLNAGEHCDDAQVDITATLTKDANEIAGDYSDTLVFVAGIEEAPIPAPDNAVGYYADVDNNGTVDGVIFFDYTQGADTTPGFIGNGVAVASKSEGLASYELKTVDGKDNVVVKTSDGDDRFYVIGLQNVKPTSGNTDAYWYYSAGANKISDYAGLTSTAFGSGKSNTETMKALWDAETYGAKNDRDMFTIDMGDWFIPSKDEWSVLGSNLKKFAVEYYSITFPSGAQIDFDDYGYWSSSIGSKESALQAYFSNSGGGLGNDYFTGHVYVRLASTF